LFDVGFCWKVSYLIYGIDSLIWNFANNTGTHTWMKFQFLPNICIFSIRHISLV
jgi:hypothetical protein